MIRANVSPFVVYNTQNIKTPQTLIPIPSNQIIRKDKDVTLFIEAYQKLYIFTKKRKFISGDISTDGRLFINRKIYPNRYNNYTYTNPYSQLIAIKLNNMDINSSFYTTINTSAINLIKPKEINISKDSVDVISKITLTSQRYFRLKANQTISFDLDKNGTLELSIAKEISPIYNLSPHRQRLKITINRVKKYIEALNSTSHSYINNINHKAITSASKHFFILDKSKHHIIIKAEEDTLISAKIYHKNIFYKQNDIHLNWITDKSFDFINQPIWFNSKIDNGLDRFHHLDKLQNEIIDTRQKIALNIASKKSVFYKQIYPITFDKQGYEIKYRYSNPSLYLSDKSNIISDLSSSYRYNYLNNIKDGTFFDVPIYKKIENRDISVRLEQIYFRTRGYILDKSLKAEVSNFVAHLHNYKHIYLYGHTDSTASNNYNQKLSLNRAKSIKEEMIKLGIPQKDITIDYLGESNQRIKTTDNKIEDGNRRVEIKVVYPSKIYHKLQYNFRSTLQNDTYLNVTILSNDKKTKKLYITTDKGKRLTLNYVYNENLDSFRVDNSQKEYSQRDKSIVAILKNSKELEFKKNTGSLSVKIPKNTKYITILRGNNSKFKVSLKILENSRYKDTIFNLTHNYKNTYNKFYKSLHTKVNKKFNPWYEHTHPLRLLLLSNIKTAQNNLTKANISNISTINYAKRLYQSKDNMASKQIAKHGIFRGLNQKIISLSHNLLLDMSKSNAEKLLYESAYFYKTASSSSLEKIASILQDENKNSYALDTLLLLPHTPNILKKICHISLIENRFNIYKNLCNKNNTNFINLKKEAIKNNINRFRVTNRDYKVLNYQGKKTLYSKDRNLYFTMYRVTNTHPLEIDIDANTMVAFDIRFDTNTTKYQWLKIEELNRVYHYPLTNFAISKTLKILPEKRDVSSANHLALTFGKGRHKIRLSAYEKPILVYIKSKKAKLKDIRPLSKQILKTSTYSPYKFLTMRDKDNIPYASALLWNYLFENLYYRRNAQGEAFLLKEKSKDRDINNILSIVLKYSSFKPYLSLEAPLGFYDVPIPVWSPSSVIEKNRLPLITNLSTFDIVLHGHIKKIIHLDGEEDFTIEVKAFYTKYFPTQTISFYIICDDKKPKIIHINPKTQTYKHTFHIPSGRHSMKIGLLNPLSSQYLAFNLCEDGEPIEREVSKRYFASSHENPIVVRDVGSKLILIEEIDGDNIVHKSYKFYPKEKEFSLKVLPSLSSSEGLFRISKLEFNPLKKLSSHLSIASKLNIPLDNREPRVERIFKKDTNQSKTRQQKYIPIEYHTPTLALEFKNSSIRLGSIDSNSKLTTNVSEIGVYWSSRINKNLYLQAHYFARLYTNPLYGLKHKAYIKLPYLPNLYSIIDINAYLQKNNNYLFKHINVKSEIYKTDKISKDISHTYGLGGFKRFLDYDKSNKSNLDPQIYSKYKLQHQYGIFAKYNLLYNLYDDIKIGLKSSAHTNEDIKTIDNIKMTLNIFKHIKDFDIKLSFDSWNYFKDRDRKKNYNMKRIGASIKFDRFINTNRLHIESGAKYDFTAKSPEFSFSMVWNFSKNRRYYNLFPNKKIFNPLKRRLNDER